MNHKLFYVYHFPMSLYWRNNHGGGFTQLSLDFSSRCNYNCDWCFNKHLLNKRDEDMLSLGERATLLEQAVECGAKTLVIPGTGEPTLDPYFTETIQIAHKLGLITVVYSNLTGNLRDETIGFMFEHNVSIGVKLDSFSQWYFVERYHTNLRNSSKFRENLSKIVDTYRGSQIAVETGTAYRIIANMVLTKENAVEINEIHDFCTDSDIPLFVRPVKPVIWAGENPELWEQIGNEKGSLSPEDKLIRLAKEKNTLFSPSSTVENHCAIFSFGLTVKSNGDVQLCPDHHESRGMFNVRNTPLKEIMASLNSKRKIKSGYCVMLDKIQH